MKDGLQNVPLDRWLMRIKDVCSILSSIFSTASVIIGILWIGFKFIAAQAEQQRILNDQQKVMNMLLQGQVHNGEK
jgi:hypothetical protein